MALPKIEILTTGGTIAGKGESETGSSYHAGEVPGDELVRSVPGLSRVADITVREIASIPSQDMTEGVWLALLSAIREDAEKFDGFVIAGRHQRRPRWSGGNRGPQREDTHL